MKLNDEEIFELFRGRAKEDYGTDDDEYNDLSEYEKARIYAANKLKNHKSILDTMTEEQKEFLKNYDGPIGVGAVSIPQHPHSSREYVKWMAEVWKKNDERNKLQSLQSTD